MPKGCTHPMMLSNMCAVCGAVLDEEYDTENFSSLTMTGGNVLRVSSDEALSIQQNKTAILQQSRRLALVLDIDNTLIHATFANGRAPDTHRQHENSTDIYHLPLEEAGIDGIWRHLVIKKRPHLDLFLSEMNSLFQMTIYTTGTKRYAEAVTQVIDPQGTYIGSRIVARLEDSVNGILDKSLEKIFLKDSSMAVILDDRDDVWGGPQIDQLLVVRPYEFFVPGSEASVAVQACPEMGYVNNAPGTVPLGAARPSSSAVSDPLVPVIALHRPRPGVTIGMAQRSSAKCTEADDQLPRCIDLLSSLHQHYFALIDQQQQLQTGSSPTSFSANTALGTGNHVLQPTVAELLRHHRSLTLRGCVIAIGLDAQMPADMKRDFSHRMCHLARSLGAMVVVDVLHPRTSHVLALTDNCSLVYEALANRLQDVWLLHVDWLHHCRWTLAKAEETTFMLRPPALGMPLPQPKFYVPSPSLSHSTVVDPSDVTVAASDDMTIGKRKRNHEGTLTSTTSTSPLLSTSGIETSSNTTEPRNAKNEMDCANGIERRMESETQRLPKRRKNVTIVENFNEAPSGKRLNNDHTATIPAADSMLLKKDTNDDKMLREVKRAARLHRLSEERRRQQQYLQRQLGTSYHGVTADMATNQYPDDDDDDDDDNYDEYEVFDRDSGMPCCMGPGDDDEEEQEQEHTEANSLNSSSNIDESEGVRYSKFDASTVQNRTEEDDGDGYVVQSGADGDHDEDEDEEEEEEREMDLVQKLRSRCSQNPTHLQQSQELLPNLGGEGFIAPSGMNSYPSSVPTGSNSHLGAQSSSLEMTEKVLASIAPGPMVDMDEEEESSMQS